MQKCENINCCEYRKKEPNGCGTHTDIWDCDFGPVVGKTEPVAKLQLQRGVKCVAAQAYQVIGALTLEDKRYPNKEKERALDYFSGIAQGDTNPDDKFLPWG